MMLYRTIASLKNWGGSRILGVRIVGHVQMWCSHYGEVLAAANLVGFDGGGVGWKGEREERSSRA